MELEGSARNMESAATRPVVQALGKKTKRIRNRAYGALPADNGRPAATSHRATCSASARAASTRPVVQALASARAASTRPVVQALASARAASTRPVVQALGKKPKRIRKRAYGALPVDNERPATTSHRATCSASARAACTLLCLLSSVALAAIASSRRFFAASFAYHTLPPARPLPHLPPMPPPNPPPNTPTSPSMPPPLQPPGPPFSPPPFPPSSPPSPKAPPPQAPAPGYAVLARINTRFAQAEPSNDLDLCGVLVHNFDEISNQLTPWRPCRFGGCALKFSDRFPCSIIYPTNVHMYKPTAGGFVVAPGAAQVLCSYSRDGLTMTGSKTCPLPTPRYCIPGCGWAPYEWCPQAKPWRCAWPPDKLDQMLTKHQQNPHVHNEVVLEARAWSEQLPRTIEAVWFFEQGEAGAEHDRGILSKARAYVEDVHERFLDEFELSSSDVPLLAFNPTRSNPFRLA